MKKNTCKWLLLPYWFWGVCALFSHFLSRPFFERRMGQEIEGDVLGEAYKGYVFRLTGGNDKDGFAMKQGIMVNGRTRMLFRGRMYSFSSPLFNNTNHLIRFCFRCYNLQTKKNRWTQTQIRPWLHLRRWSRRYLPENCQERWERYRRSHQRWSSQSQSPQESKQNQKDVCFGQRQRRCLQIRKPPHY